MRSWIQRLRIMRKKRITLTLEEAYLLKCAAWDGPEPTGREQKVLDRVLERIEKVVDEECG